MKLKYNCNRCGIEQQTEIAPGVDITAYIGMMMCDKCASDHRRAFNLLQIETQKKINLNDAKIPEKFMTFDKSIGNLALSKRIFEARTKSLFIFGGYGVGKTSCACASLKYAIEHDYKRCKYIRMTDFSDEYLAARKVSEYYSKNYLQNLLSNDILLLDDVTKDLLSDSIGKALFSMIDRIYDGSTRCRLWMTSNKTMGDFGRKFADLDTAASIIDRFKRLESLGKFEEVEGVK